MSLYVSLFIYRVASVHLPRIGHSTPHFNWYGTERLIRKHLVMRRISTFVYPLYNDSFLPRLHHQIFVNDDCTDFVWDKFRLSMRGSQD